MVSAFDAISRVITRAWPDTSSPLDAFNRTFAGIPNSVRTTMTNPSATAPPHYFLLTTQNIALALIVSLFILLLIYLISAYRKDERKIAYVKTEIYEIVISGIIGFSILAITYWFCTMPIINIFTKSSMGTESIYNVTQQYFIESESYVQDFNLATYIIGTRLDLESSIAPTAKPLSIGMQSKPFIGLIQPLKQIDYNAFISTVVFLITLYGFQYITSLGAYVSLNFFLPLGVLLRAFSPTRRYGGAVLGLALGFLIILPFMFSMSYEMLYGTNQQGENYGLINFGPDILSGVTNELTDSGTIQINGVVDLLKSAIRNITEGLKETGKDLVAGNYGNAIKDLYSIYLNYIIEIIYMAMGVMWEGIFIALVMPVFSFYLFAEATRYLAGSLGEEINVFGITRLI